MVILMPVVVVAVVVGGVVGVAVRREKAHCNARTLTPNSRLMGRVGVARAVLWVCLGPPISVTPRFRPSLLGYRLVRAR